MDFLTRRKFLLASGVTGAGAIAAGVTWLPMKEIMQTAGELTGLAPGVPKILVIVTLYGGNDGLNTVIPYNDPAYAKARPDLAYDEGEVLKLDEVAGLNPALKGMHQAFERKQVAIVRSVGYPKPDRSHFRSMDIWHTGEPERPGNTGWLGRWLDTAGGDPRLAVSFEQVLPPLLAGEASAGAVVGGNGLRLPKTFNMKSISGLGQVVPGEPKLQARAASCFEALAGVDQLIKDVIEDAAERAKAGETQATGTGGQTAIQQQFNLVAQCIEAKVATRVFSVSLGGFDTHADEKQPHQTLLGMLDRAVTGFLDRMSKSEQGKNVVVLVYSEFGRRVKANASDGTDHGTASDVFLLGHGVKGGIYGQPPDLKDLDRGGDLKYTTDFRDVYATVLERVLETDADRVLPKWSGRLPQIV
ncbi:DUF1501 domain-containing protein [Allorhizocola rhizosphaerae]|uniref:DUF1501 domain-containing protein n=1 Tax=Allorhizocola rhizosphaerae TaxID=1872709 RepID=UPI000E3E3272|nr:DUF1501 domain-containing protein [Allorhizocola rhizosphaerae]